VGCRAVLDILEKTNKLFFPVRDLTADPQAGILAATSTELPRLAMRIHTGSYSYNMLRAFRLYNDIPFVWLTAPRLCGGNGPHDFREATFPLQGQ
jgi:hypothetical protein